MAFRNRLLTAVIGLFFATDEPPNQRIEIGPSSDEPGRNEIRFFSALDEPVTNAETAPGIISVSGQRVDLVDDESRGELLVRAPEIDGFEGPSTLWSNRVSDLGNYLAHIIHTAATHIFVGDTIMDDVSVSNITVRPFGVITIDGGLLSFSIGKTISGINFDVESGVTNLAGLRQVDHGLGGIPAVILITPQGNSNIRGYVVSKTDTTFLTEWRRETDNTLLISVAISFNWLAVTI